MKPETDSQAGITANYGGRHKRQYWHGSKRILKRQARRAARRHAPKKGKS